MGSDSVGMADRTFAATGMQYWTVMRPSSLASAMRVRVSLTVHRIIPSRCLRPTFHRWSPSTTTVPPSCIVTR